MATVTGTNSRWLEIAVTGTPEAVATGVQQVAQVTGVDEVTNPYPVSGRSGLVTVYITVDPGPAAAEAAS